MKLSFGNKVFLSIAAAFAVIIIAVLTYLRFDDLLMSTLKEDLIFKWFGIGLFVFLVVFLLLYSNKVDRDFKEDSSRKHTEISRQLTQNISHELKTPVASIKGYLETILENPDMPEETRIGFLSRCLSQTQRLTSLLDDLSLLNRMGDTEDIDALFPMHPIDVMDTITQLSKEKAQVLQSKGMSLRTGLPSKIDLNGNESLIYSIFRNLLDNAIMYAGDGAVISLSAYREGSSWHFTFADNGPGVDKEHLDHLFDRFYRVDKSRSRASGGTGLGLTIVRNAVRRHGGTIGDAP